MGYTRLTPLGDVSADTLAYQRLHDAALKVIAARNAGNAAAQAAAQATFNALAGSNTDRVKALKEAESADTGFFGGLTATLDKLGTLGKVALGGAVLVLILKSGLLRGQLKRNPHRRSRRSGKRHRPFRRGLVHRRR